MNDQRGKFSVATLGLIGLLLSGCAGNGLQLPGMAFGNAGGTGVEFERTPYVLPSVVAVSTPENPNVSKFLMNLSVTISRCRSGSFTARNASRTAASAITNHPVLDSVGCYRTDDG